MALTEFRDDYLDDLTNGSGGSHADYPTYGFAYAEQKPGAVAYMTTVECQDFPGAVDGWTTWGRNILLGNVIFQAVLGCDDRKGGDATPRGSDSFDWTKICP